MTASALYAFIADAVLLVHAGVVVFVVGGLVLVVAGNCFQWVWANNFWFRTTHLCAIGFVVAESWLGLACPLTTLEAWLRSRAGEATHGAGFIEYWLQALLFYQAPSWVFLMAYTLFGLLVVAAWWYFPPVKPWQKKERD